MRGTRGQRRDAFTLIELVVVVMILGILAAIAAPKLLGTGKTATDEGLRHSLYVIRSAIEQFAVNNDSTLPGADGSESTFLADLKQYLRGKEFPICPVGPAGNNQVYLFAGSSNVAAQVTSSTATHGWLYRYDTGDFYANSDELSHDDETKYYEF